MTARPDPNGRACRDCAHFVPAADSFGDLCAWTGQQTAVARVPGGGCGEVGREWAASTAPGGAPRPPLRIV